VVQENYDNASEHQSEMQWVPTIEQRFLMNLSISSLEFIEPPNFEFSCINLI
jgi:hypothetical protein